jgi:hypothetical protein
MKRLLLCGTLALAGCHNAPPQPPPPAPREKPAWVTSMIPMAPSVPRDPQYAALTNAQMDQAVPEVTVNQLVVKVRENGYRCDSVTSATRWDPSAGRGYTLNCNCFQYTYEVFDSGGDHWTARQADPR